MLVRFTKNVRPETTRSGKPVLVGTEIMTDSKVNIYGQSATPEGRARELAEYAKSIRKTIPDGGVCHILGNSKANQNVNSDSGNEGKVTVNFFGCEIGAPATAEQKTEAYTKNDELTINQILENKKSAGVRKFDGAGYKPDASAAKAMADQMTAIFAEAKL